MVGCRIGIEADCLAEGVGRVVEAAEGEEGGGTLPVQVGGVRVGGDGPGEEVEGGLVLALVAGSAGLLEQAADHHEPIVGPALTVVVHQAFIGLYVGCHRTVARAWNVFSIAITSLHALAPAGHHRGRRRDLA